MSPPRTMTFPFWIFLAPPINPMSDDLPTPSGPIRPTIRPGGMSIVMSSKARVLPSVVRDTPDGSHGLSRAGHQRYLRFGARHGPSPPESSRSHGTLACDSEVTGSVLGIAMLLLRESGQATASSYRT